MNLALTSTASEPGAVSASAQKRLLRVWGEPLFYADWLQPVFIHFEVDAEVLQREVPYPLDLREGRAYLSLVAFTMRGMRPRRGGRLAALLFKPIATHQFLNVRAYVRHQDEPGIYFLAEWLNNPISVRLGPRLFGLPYRFGRLNYRHEFQTGKLCGSVSEARSNDSQLAYTAEIDPDANFVPCDADSLDEFLVERYTAFTAKPTLRAPGISSKGFFRIWHPPWPQTPIQLTSLDTSLLTQTWPWFGNAQLVGANYSPGIQNVWMGRPQKI